MGTVTPLMELFLRRRSVRKYEAGEASSSQVAAILAQVQAFQARCGFSAAYLTIITGNDYEQVMAVPFAIPDAVRVLSMVAVGWTGD